jgi:hypothetical protein
MLSDSEVLARYWLLGVEDNNLVYKSGMPRPTSETDAIAELSDTRSMMTCMVWFYDSLRRFDAGAAVSSSSSSSNGSRQTSASPLISGPGDAERLGTFSLPLATGRSSSSSSSSTSTSEGQSGLPTGSLSTSCSPGIFDVPLPFDDPACAFTRSVVDTPFEAVKSEAGRTVPSSRFSPPTMNGLLKASTRELTLVAPRPLTPDKTFEGCLTRLAKDYWSIHTIPKNHIVRV